MSTSSLYSPRTKILVSLSLLLSLFLIHPEINHSTSSTLVQIIIISALNYGKSPWANIPASTAVQSSLLPKQSFLHSSHQGDPFKSLIISLLYSKEWLPFSLRVLDKIRTKACKASPNLISHSHLPDFIFTTLTLLSPPQPNQPLSCPQTCPVHSWLKAFANAFPSGLTLFPQKGVWSTYSLPSGLGLKCHALQEVFPGSL